MALKSTSGWSKINGTNQFGFSAEPTGYYRGAGWNYYKDDEVMYWTTSNSGGTPYMLRLSGENFSYKNYDLELHVFLDYKAHIRCIKEKDEK